MSKIYNGSDQVTRLYVGAQEVFKMYDGSTLLWEKPAVPVNKDAYIHSISMMQIPNTGTQTKQIPKAEGVAVGDMMIMYMTCDYALPATTESPTGWVKLTELGSTSTTNRGPRFIVCYKYATSQDLTINTYPFDIDGGADARLDVLCVKNVNTSLTPGWASISTASSRTTHSAPTATPKSGRNLLICNAAWNIIGPTPATSFSWTPPTGFSERTDAHTNGWTTLTVADMRYDSTAATGTRPFALSTNDTTARQGFASSMVIPSTPL